MARCDAETGAGRCPNESVATTTIDGHGFAVCPVHAVLDSDATWDGARAWVRWRGDVFAVRHWAGEHGGEATDAD
jgi:hypothetical protein